MIDLLARYEPMLAVPTAPHVWKGRDRRTGEAVAIKRLSEGGLRERHALRLAHLPGVVELLDHGAWDGAPAIVLRWVEGGPFPGTDGGEPCTLRRRLGDLLLTVGALHDLGLVHRDLKPSNVWVDRSGRVVILDLGLAVSDGAGRGSGTLEYQAPEQIVGQVGPASDLFAVGVIGFEALTGRLPFATVGAKLAGRAAPVPASTPSDLRTVLAGLLAVHPVDRFSSARAAFDVLDAVEWPDLEGPARGDHTLLLASTRLAGGLADRNGLRADWRRAGVTDGGRLIPAAFRRWCTGTANDANEAMDRGLAAAEAGDPGSAVAWLRRSVGLLRGTDRWTEGMACWAKCAVASGRLADVDQALAEASLGPALPWVPALEATRASLRSDRGRAYELARSAPDHLLTHVAACTAARWLPPEVHADAAARFSAFAEREGDAEVRCAAHNVRGHLAYRREDPTSAAEAFATAARIAPTLGQRVGARLNEAAAWLEVPDPLRALAALSVIETSVPETVLRVRTLRRIGAYRAGRAHHPDVPWVVSLGLADDPHLGLAALTEAAVAWRRGAFALGRRLAWLSAAGFEARDQAPGALLARALAVACGAPAPIALWARLTAAQAPSLAAQARALLSGVAPRPIRSDHPTSIPREVLAPIEGGW